MFLPGSTSTNLSIPNSILNNHFHRQQQQHQQQQQQQQQQILFDNLKDQQRSSSNKFSSSMSRKNPLDPDLLRELNARYLHDIQTNRPTNGSTHPNVLETMNNLPAFLLPPFFRSEHYHQHTHTHEHTLNIFSPPTNNSSAVDKLSKSDNNSLSSFLRTSAVNNFPSTSLLPPPPPLFPPFTMPNSNASISSSSSTSSTPTTTTTTTTTTTVTIPTTPTAAATTTTNSNSNSNSSSRKETSSPLAKKSNKWCAAHVRISWMIYHQQKRSKDKSSVTENKRDDEHQQQQQQQSSSSSSLAMTKPLLPPPLSLSSVSSMNNDLPLPLPSNYSVPLLPPSLPPSLPSVPPPPPTGFNFRTPFDYPSVSNGPFGRVLPSSSTAFGGLGSLFPVVSQSTTSGTNPLLSSMERKSSDLNGSLTAGAAAAANLGLDWSRFHNRLSSNNDNPSMKKLDEINNSNHNDKKRSSSCVNNDDERRNSHHHHHSHPHPHPPHHHLMPPPSHSSSNRSLQHHQHHLSLSLSSPVPPPTVPSSSSSSSSSALSLSSSSSSSKKRYSPTSKLISSENSKTSSLPATPFPGLDPLTMSLIERQRLTNAYASLFSLPSSPNLFPNLDSSPAMAAALLQREHFLNSLRLSQQQQHEQMIDRERSMGKIPKTTVTIKNEQTSPKLNEETTRNSPKVATSPGSHSSTSSSSRSSSSKAKRMKTSSSPSPTNIKQESIIESTPSIPIMTT